jgi:hypothetical protein
MRWQKRLARLEAQVLPRSPEDRDWQRRWAAIVERWLRLAEAAMPLLTDADQQRVVQALTQHVEDRHGAFADWFRDLSEGRCRLPELAPEVMQALLLAWLSPAADGGLVCRGCGLEYPRHRQPPLTTWKLLPGKKPGEGPPPWYDLPELFAACPNCGGSRFEIDWPHQTGEQERGWQRLDGYVGPSRRP